MSSFSRNHFTIIGPFNWSTQLYGSPCATTGTVTSTLSTTVSEFLPFSQESLANTCIHMMGMHTRETMKMTNHNVISSGDRLINNCSFPKPYVLYIEMCTNGSSHMILMKQRKGNKQVWILQKTKVLLC